MESVNARTKSLREKVIFDYFIFVEQELKQAHHRRVKDAQECVFGEFHVLEYVMECLLLRFRLLVPGLLVLEYLVLEAEARP